MVAVPGCDVADCLSCLIRNQPEGPSHLQLRSNGTVGEFRAQTSTPRRGLGPSQNSRVEKTVKALRLLVCRRGAKCSLVLSLVRQVYTWSPWRRHPSHLLCLSLSQAAVAAASRASGHSRPQPPSHIEHTPSPPQLLFFFLFFFFVCFFV